MQAIITKYHGPTNTKGERITARADAGRVCIPYPYELSGEDVHKAAAEKLRERLGWHGTLAGGSIPGGGYAFVLVTEG